MYFSSRSLHQELGPPQNRTPAPSMEMHLPDPQAPPRPPPTSTLGKNKRSILTLKGWVRLFEATSGREAEIVFDGVGGAVVAVARWHRQGVVGGGM